MSSDAPLVLGIETSCDETGIGLVRGTTLVGESLASSVAEHARFGGVVPEVASRAHVDAFLPALHRACAAAGVALGDIDAVAVTAGPGLAGALLVGVAAAKALALGLDRPLLAVHHLAAHVAVDRLESGPLPADLVALLVSGGHTSLLTVDDPALPRTLGATVDDAAGEAYDKVARLLGLPFPGGPHLDRLAAQHAGGDLVPFPRGKADDGTFDFSFSGLKTAVARWLTAHPEADRRWVAASFQEAVADVLTAKAVAACRARGAGTLLLGGGVAANGRLRALAAQRCAAAGLQLRVPPPRLCTDNGAMVAALGAWLLERGAAPSALDSPARSSWPLPAAP